MASTTVELGVPLAVAVVLAGLAAAALGRATQLGTGPATITAAGRAVLQLGAVSLLIGAIVGSLLLSAAFVLLMVVIAAGTGARRMTRARNGWWALLPVALPLPVVAALVAGGVVPPTGLAIVPTAGILVGGAMTATVLAGRRALDELATRRGEVEAALSLGLLPRDAAVEIARPAAAQALTPVMDQTRTVGLVTLPGAFVGMLLGGASPLAAGAVQLLVLIVLLLVETVAVAVVIDLVCRGLITRPA